MRKRFFSSGKKLLVAGAIAFLCGCAGNGMGLDDQGNPIGDDNGGLPVSFDPTFSSIQQNVLSRICIDCHFGAAAPEGLRLDDQNAYDNLVNVASSEQPDLLRVNPGNPDASYMIRKLEGGPDITGGQMPLDRAPLDQQTINTIRLWIAQGAPRN